MGISGQYTCGLTTGTYLNFFLLNYYRDIFCYKQGLVNTKSEIQFSGWLESLLLLDCKCFVLGNGTALDTFDQNAAFPTHLVFFGS